jgi:hypothetical protein
VLATQVANAVFYLNKEQCKILKILRCYMLAT